MSYTTLYILNQKSTTYQKEYSNSGVSAPLVWDYLSIKYLGLKRMPLGYSSDKEQDLQRLWDLAVDPRLSEDEVVVHRMTFDNEYVPIHLFQMAADSCRIFFSKSLAELGRERENHWYSIGDDLERLTEKKLNRFARGACLGCTSVSDPWCDNRILPKAVSIENGLLRYQAAKETVHS